MKTRKQYYEKKTQMENLAKPFQLLFIAICLVGIIILNVFHLNGDRIMSNLLYLIALGIFFCIGSLIYNKRIEKFDLLYKIMTLKLYLENEKNIPTELKTIIEKEITNRKPFLNYQLTSLAEAYSKKLYEKSQEGQFFLKNQLQRENIAQLFDDEINRISNKDNNLPKEFIDKGISMNDIDSLENIDYTSDEREVLKDLLIHSIKLLKSNKREKYFSFMKYVIGELKNI